MASLLTSASWGRRAGAAPWFDVGEGDLEDRYADGEIDEEDVVAMHMRPGSSDVHGESWISILGFSRRLQSGKNDLGGMVVVSLAFDRMAEGSVHRLSDPPRGGPPAPVPAMASVQKRHPAPGVARAMARECVAAAWRTSGLGVDDASLDAIVSRSHASALLPETRVRAMRLWDDASHTTTTVTTDGTDLYEALGANLVLELRLTWRLDRLLYAGDEPTIERARLERLDARSRLATRVLEGLFAWARALVEADEAIAGSHEEAQARLRMDEAQATLDVLTGGWFSERLAATPPSPSGTPSP